MENVKFVRSEENDDEMILYFQICDPLADFVREHTNYGEKGLSLYLDEDNRYCYIIRRSEALNENLNALTEMIEKISNEKDDAYFYNHLITDNGHPRSPSEIHALMRTEYGLADIDEAEEGKKPDRKDLDLEWWTAHFFIGFGRLLFGDEDTPASGMTHTAVSRLEVSAFLDILKSVDKIVIVDDARKY